LYEHHPLPSTKYGCIKVLIFFVPSENVISINVELSDSIVDNTISFSIFLSSILKD